MNDYLTRFGYFPNAELAREYPAWRPIVDTAPANPSVFDERTEAALRRLQANNGLPTTGSPIRRRAASCRWSGVGFRTGSKTSPPVTSSSSTASAVGGRLQGLVRRVRIQQRHLPDDAGLRNLPSGVPLGCRGRGDVLARDGRRPSLVPHISVGWGNPPAGAIATTTGWGSANAVITLRPTHSDGKMWTTSSTPTMNQYSVRAALMHNVGHALGLHHSPFIGTVMEPHFPAAGPVSIASRTTTGWRSVRRGTSIRRPMVSGLVDIAVGEDGTDGSVWVVGADDQLGGKGIYKLVNSTWVPDATAPGAVRFGATSIAVQSDGRPIVTQAQSLPQGARIFERNSADPNVPGWTELSGNGFALDVGVGGGHIWIIGTNNIVYKRVGEGWTMDSTMRHGQRISVGHPVGPAVGHRRRSRIQAKLERCDQRRVDGRWAWTTSPAGGPSDVDGAAVFATNKTAGHIIVWSQQPGSGSGEFVIPANENWRSPATTESAESSPPTGFNARMGIGVTEAREALGRGDRQPVLQARQSSGQARASCALLLLLAPPPDSPAAARGERTRATTKPRRRWCTARTIGASTSSHGGRPARADVRIDGRARAARGAPPRRKRNYDRRPQLGRAGRAVSGRSVRRPARGGVLQRCPGRLGSGAHRRTLPAAAGARRLCGRVRLCVRNAGPPRGRGRGRRQSGRDRAREAGSGRRHAPARLRVVAARAPGLGAAASCAHSCRCGAGRRRGHRLHRSGGGVPLKLDAGGRVRDARADARDYFAASTDTAGGSSGGGAFDGSLALVGVMARGSDDLTSTDEGCARIVHLPDGPDASEQFTYAGRALEGLCAARPKMSTLCRPNCGEPCQASPPPPPAAGCSIAPATPAHGLR